MVDNRFSTRLHLTTKNTEIWTSIHFILKSFFKGGLHFKYTALQFANTIAIKTNSKDLNISKVDVNNACNVFHKKLLLTMQCSTAEKIKKVQY